MTETVSTRHHESISFCPSTSNTVIITSLCNWSLKLRETSVSSERYRETHVILGASCMSSALYVQYQRSFPVFSQVLHSCPLFVVVNAYLWDRKVQRKAAGH
jgi:type IV secretory pathway TrbF-like protein